MGAGVEAGVGLEVNDFLGISLFLAPRACLTDSCIKMHMRVWEKGKEKPFSENFPSDAIAPASFAISTYVDRTQE